MSKYEVSAHSIESMHRSEVYNQWTQFEEFPRFMESGKEPFQEGHITVLLSQEEPVVKKDPSFQGSSLGILEGVSI